MDGIEAVMCQGSGRPMLPPPVSNCPAALSRPICTARIALHSWDQLPAYLCQTQVRKANGHRHASQHGEAIGWVGPRQVELRSWARMGPLPVGPSLPISPARRHAASIATIEHGRAG